MELNKAQEGLLLYLKGRMTPISVFDLAERFNRTTKSIHGSLKPLVEAGLVRSEYGPARRSIVSKTVKASFYEAVEKNERKERVKPVKFSFNNPFNLGVRS